MTIYQKLNYREALRTLFQETKLKNPSLTWASLASKCRLQPSYLTNVLNGRGDFNSDQIYALATELSATEEELEFLGLLLEYNRTTITSRKEKLRQRIQWIRDQHLNAGKAMKSQPLPLSDASQMEYFLDPYIEIIHYYLSTDKASNEAQTIAGHFGLPVGRVIKILDLLKKLGFIQFKGKALEIKNSIQHLPKESPLAKPHLLHLRQLSIDRLQRLDLDRYYSVSAVLVTDKECIERIRHDFLNLLKELQGPLQKSPSEDLYQLNFDLFPWV